VLHALDDAMPQTAIVFSSIAGRFGNAGQTDYSAANDLLCKSVSNLRRRSPGTRGIAIDWTAWAGIGMASRGSIPKTMQAAGIDMLPPDVGVPVVRRELTAGGIGGEVLVAGDLGVLLEERHPSGGFEPQSISKGLADRSGPMTGSIAEVTVTGGLRVLTELDPSQQAFLDDHRIEGIPVLPGVMGMEGFAEVARLLEPGWEVVALEDVELLVPFKFYRDQPRTLELRALIRDGGDGTLVADCQLIGRRLIHGQGEQEAQHVRGRVRLARELPAAPLAAVPPADSGQDGVGREAVYRVFFHGPAYRVLDRVWCEDGQIVGRLAGELPADHQPESRPTEFVPRLIELCFQTAGVWELGNAGRMALPTRLERVVRFAGADAPGGLWAVVTPREDAGVDAEVVDDTGHVRVRLEGYRTIELPGGVDAGALAPIRAAMGRE
jgi:Polyketide synthase dehydratase/KR domain